MLVKSCFCKVGVLQKDFSVVACLVPAGSDPFSDIDKSKQDRSEDGGCVELAEYIHCIQEPKNACSISELLALESEIPVCSEFADSEEYMAEVGPQNR